MSLGGNPYGQHYFFNDTSSMDTPASTYDIARIVEAAHERADYMLRLAANIDRIEANSRTDAATLAAAARELRQLASK
jgi:hypothetical protein